MVRQQLKLNIEFITISELGDLTLMYKIMIIYQCIILIDYRDSQLFLMLLELINVIYPLSYDFTMSLASSLVDSLTQS